MNKKKKISVGRVGLNLFLTVISITYILTLVLMIAISLTQESAIKDYGYRLFPKVFSLDAYRQALANPAQILNSYQVTIAYSLLATVLSILVQSLMAYPLSRMGFKYKKPILVYLMITMFFSGGLVPTYILNTQYLGLNNSFWIYIFPALMNAWNVVLFKTFYLGLPEGLVESAKIDGASELKIYFRIMLPLSTPILATLGFITLIAKWNDWNTSLLYIRDSNLYSLQYLLQKIINEADYFKQLRGTGADALFNGAELPNESLKYAVAVLVAGPMMLVFPFFQKYFAKGLVVGSVKG